MEERILKVKPKCTSPTFGLKLARDKLYGCIYVQDIEKKSSAVHTSSYCNSYLVEIVSNCIFSKAEAVTVFINLRELL